jgi:hypothetical protein
VNWRRRYWELGGSAAQLLLLFLGAQLESPFAWLWILSAIALISLLAWVIAWQHVRAIDDTPTSKVASAAQGYVELQGIGQPFDGGQPVLSALGLTPCLWYRFQVEARKDNKWVTQRRGESDASFVLDDGSGRCIIDPEGAQVFTEKKSQWVRGDERYTEWLIGASEPVYALGQFVTRGGADPVRDVSEDMKYLLAQWKRDAPALMRRFDLDGDGQLDEREWELARAAARREVITAHRHQAPHAEAHLMHAPHDGRLYLLASIAPEQLVKRYRLWCGFHLTCFFAALGALGWVWQRV